MTPVSPGLTTVNFMVFDTLTAGQYVLYQGQYLDEWVCAGGEHLFQIYWRLIGRPHIALAWPDKIYRNISDALGRLRSDHEYFSIYPNNNTSQCIAEQMRKDWLKQQQQFKYTTNFSTTFHFYFLRLFISSLKMISSYHSTINLCRAPDPPVQQRTRDLLPSSGLQQKYIANISGLAALTRHSLGS